MVDGAVRFSDSPYACASLLCGKLYEDFLCAAVLGFTLRDRGTLYDIVLMHTPDVPQPWLRPLSDIGWKLEEVPYIGQSGQYYQSGDIDFSFTMLHVMRLPYEKVLLLSIHTMVRKNIDELFARSTPAALRWATPCMHTAGVYQY